MLRAASGTSANYTYEFFFFHTFLRRQREAICLSKPARNVIKKEGPQACGWRGTLVVLQRCEGPFHDIWKMRIWRYFSEFSMVIFDLRQI
jgi:hypothetical protein